MVRAGDHGWYAWLSQEWPPVAIWRIASANGLRWELFGQDQPEIVKPAGAMIKNLSAWYEAETGLVHGYVGVWSDIGGGERNYRLYHATMRPGR